jgi:hypothetical protein
MLRGPGRGRRRRRQGALLVGECKIPAFLVLGHAVSSWKMMPRGISVGRGHGAIHTQGDFSRRLTRWMWPYSPPSDVTLIPSFDSPPCHLSSKTSEASWPSRLMITQEFAIPNVTKASLPANAAQTPAEHVTSWSRLWPIPANPSRPSGRWLRKGLQRHLAAHQAPTRIDQL